MAEFQEVMKQRRRMCKNQSFCLTCSLNSENECDVFINNNPQQAEEIIMKWAEKHPIKTNADKFNEVFGTLFDGICNNIPCDCECDTCELNNFWNQEYKEPKVVEE